MQECYELSEFLIKATGLSMKLIKLIQCLSVVSRILVIRHLRNLTKKSATCISYTLLRVRPNFT